MVALSDIDGVFLKKCLPYAIGGAVIVASVPLVKKLLLLRPRASRNVDLSKLPRDKVTLFQLRRGPWAPSMSPFPLKLETYLRMADIPYENDFHAIFSSKNKTPWMAYEGEELADTHFCIQHLNKKRAVDLNASLSREQRAQAWAIQTLLEDHLYWCGIMWRWVYNFESEEGRCFMATGMGMSAVFMKMIGRRLGDQAHAQGIGRHTREEVNELAERDLRALSDLLGDKPFFMGQEPTEVDCSAFGLLAQLQWHSPVGPMTAILTGDCANLGAYCERIKEKLWPDWDDCITHGGTRKPTK